MSDEHKPTAAERLAEAVASYEHNMVHNAPRNTLELETLRGVLADLRAFEQASPPEL